MAGTINTGSFPKGLWPGVYAWWGLNYDHDNMQYKALFDVVSSGKAYEEMVEAVGLGLAPEKEQGSAVQYDTMKQGFVNRFVNKTYGLGYKITEEEREDNQYETLIRQRTARLAQSMRTTKETVAANFYNNAFTTTFADGQALIATAHPNSYAAAQSNRGTDADLSESSIEDLCIDIMSAEDSRGLKIALMPKNIIVPTATHFEVQRVLGSQLQNNTANNAINVLKANGTIPEIAVNQYLTDDDAWFIRTNATDGMTCFERRAADFSQDNDFDTTNWKFKGTERYTFGFGDWRGIYGNAGAV